MNTDLIISKINNKTRAIFLSYILGFNCLTKKLLDYLRKRKIVLIEDVCESHGAKFQRKKLGTFGWSSNFSILLCSPHEHNRELAWFVQTIKKHIKFINVKDHGMIREVKDIKFKKNIKQKYKDLNSQFIFYHLGYNLRNTEIGGVLGQSQIKRLDYNIQKRNNNLKNIF